MGGIRGVVVSGRIGILLTEKGVAGWGDMGNIWKTRNGRMNADRVWGRYIWSITRSIAY